MGRHEGSLRERVLHHQIPARLNRSDQPRSWTNWKYVSVRRLLIIIEHSIERGVQCVLFEHNLRAALGIRVNVRSLRHTQTYIDNGRLVILVGVAPAQPVEVVIVRIDIWTT